MSQKIQASPEYMKLQEATKEKQDEIKKIQDQIQALPGVKDVIDLSTKVNKFVNETCKAPDYVYKADVRNADGTGTEPGCVAAAKAPEPKK